MNIFARRYFIMDNNGHYYKAAGDSGLTEVTSAECADMFDILEANKKICASENRKNLKVSQVSKKFLYTKTVPAEDKMQVKDYDFEDIERLINDFCGMKRSITACIEKAKNDLSNSDLEISDIMHYIELYDIGTDESADLVAKLREYRQKRRAAKDKMEIISVLENSVFADNIVSQFKKAEKQIQALKNKTYSPRKIPELFEGKTRLADVHGCERQQNSEVKKMEHIKKETVFDGRKNDWLAFAVQQFDFYNNIEQYIINMEIDMEDIKFEIDGLIADCGQTKYNVVDGYAVYKKIRELRTEYAEKQKELACVKALTENLNCGKMAEVFSKGGIAVANVMNEDNSDEQQIFFTERGEVECNA